MSPTIRAFCATLFVGTLVAAAACGSDEANIGDAANDGGASSGSDGLASSSGASSGSSGDGGGVACGSESCAPGQGCLAGKCACPPYTTLCGGSCIPTIADPENCGACGVKCTGTLACAAGKCSDTCLPTQTKCGNSCVDLKTDDKNCGACGAPACPAGQGCVDGACHPKVPTTGTGPTTCTGGGSSPGVGTGASDCAGNIAQTVFRWTLCSCKDAQFSGNWLIDAYDSTQGAYQPGGMGAGFGANENYGASGTGELWGTMWIAGGSGVAPSNAHTVKGDLRSGGELKGDSAPFAIGKDAYAELDVSGGNLTIAGALHVPDGRSTAGTTNVVREPVDVVPPCDFCAPAQQVPIAALVTAHQGTSNDNASIGLNANAFASPSTPLRLDLPCGQYFLSSIASSNHVTIVAHGRTALYIGGDVNPNGVTFAVDPGGELNVFVSGSFYTSGTVRIGSPAYPAAMRVYVAGTAGLQVSDSVSIAGNLYVPNGSVQYSSDAAQYGAVYAGNFSTSKNFALHYDVGVVTSAVACAPPPGSGGSSSGGASSGGSSGGSSGTPGGPQTCGSCKDCGNQACINGVCGNACTSNGQCCPPLVCVSGSCLPAVN